MSVTLIDTSSWVEALRSQGDPTVKARVLDLLQRGTAAWCEMVRLELWNGAGDRHERRLLRDFETEIIHLPIDDRVWSDAAELAVQARSSGLTVPATDLIIFACAKVNSVAIEHCDRHFDQLAAL